jgi:hypothetical protein
MFGSIFLEKMNFHRSDNHFARNIFQPKDFFADRRARQLSLTFLACLRREGASTRWIVPQRRRR